MNPLAPISTAIPITEQTQVGEARRFAASLSLELRLSETLAGKVGIVVSELATNLVKHTRGGELLFRQLQEEDRRGIEVLSIDRGPGFDFHRCIQDGYSSSGTSGTGLGSVQRLSSEFEVFSHASGTVSVSRIWNQGPSARPNRIETGVICIPLKGEEMCGDAWRINSSGYQHRFFLVDGLGHGPEAAHAAETAIRVFQQFHDEKAAAVFQNCHLAMRSTRGGAIGMAELDLDRNVVRFIGVGNIAGVITDGTTRRSLVSQNGTVGAEMSRITEFQYPWASNSLLVLNSDGLTTRWKLDDYPGLQLRHPSIIAGVLYRDFRRERDDVTVMVVRESAK
ncbi:MAG: ATP-binding protein [Limisphaerales bacterium]